MRNKRFSSTASVFVIALAAILMGPAPATAADELILSGAVSSSAGEDMSGVMVSAKARGATVTTSVLTDGTGNYYFPPLPAGQVPGVGAGALLRYRQGRGRSRHDAPAEFRAEPLKDSCGNCPAISCCRDCRPRASRTSA